MKKTTLYIIAIVFTALSACKKDHQGGGNNNLSGMRKVSFSVTGDFTQQILQNGTSVHIGRMLTTATTATVQSTFDSVFYSVFAQSGAFIHAKAYKASTFIAITDSLAPGTYKIAIYAGEPGFNGHNYGTTPLGRDLSYGKFFKPNTFGSTFLLTVGSGNVNHTVTLTRIVADVDITITDAIPANAAKLNVARDKDYYYYDVLYARPDTTYGLLYPDLTPNIPAAAIGTTNFNVNFITLNTVNPMKITLTCYDNTNHIIAQKVIGPYNLAGNEELKLSGPLFGGGTTTHDNWHVAVDTTWSPATINKSF